MIRFIMKKTYYEAGNQMKGEVFYTIDSDVFELEKALTAGGYSESAHEQHYLIGVEVIPAS